MKNCLKIISVLACPKWNILFGGSSSGSIERKSNMNYFDNAATTVQKPRQVSEAVAEAMCSLGNAGRGVHEATLGASRVIFDTRKRLADFFHAESPKQIVFTMNSTESLNIAVKGILQSGIM